MSEELRELWCVYESGVLRFVDNNKLAAANHACKYGDLAEPELVHMVEVPKNTGPAAKQGVDREMLKRFLQFDMQYCMMVMLDRKEDSDDACIDEFLKSEAERGESD